ncbi:MAG: hypothetical protein ACI4Q4_10010 [Oscillospiraceae bacterium]
MKKNEIVLFAVGVSYFDPYNKDNQEKVDFIRKLKGFQDFHPIRPRGTILLFSTREYAEKAKKKLESSGIRTGANIGEFHIEKRFAKNGRIG